MNEWASKNKRSQEETKNKRQERDQKVKVGKQFEGDIPIEELLQLQNKIKQD